MGLWVWTLNQMLIHNLVFSNEREGFVQTQIKMYRAQSRSNHNVGGQNGPTQCVGQDQFGNKYYEDFDVKEINRWAEFNEYFDPYHTLGDRIPPAWHGQLAHVSNEAPTRTGYQYLCSHSTKNQLQTINLFHKDNCVFGFRIPRQLKL